MKATSQTENNIEADIGDAMSVNVLMRLFPMILESSGLAIVDRLRSDVWKDAANVHGMMPDSLYIKRLLEESVNSFIDMRTYSKG